MKYKPWITDNILQKISNKNKVFKKYVNSKKRFRTNEISKRFQNSTVRNILLNTKKT